MAFQRLSSIKFLPGFAPSVWAAISLTENSAVERIAIETKHKKKFLIIFMK
jgi:hypothetical protein